MGASSVTDSPLVTVIVPVYNVEKYVRDTLESTMNQGLSPAQMEVILIDDGSTDSSPRILAEYAREHDMMRVIRQENSGGPGGPRNVGIDAAQGKYLFFLDADDELTENALRDLVSVAEAEEAEVVLGKGEGINGRVVPGPAFRATRLDADLIEDNVYRTLSPWKLFRRDLVERKNIRFLETTSVGEDQPFVACAYLNAQKISVLADRPYARLRARGDGTNVTAVRRSLWQYLELATAVVGVIIAESEPGRIRDGFLARPLKRNLRPVLGKAFLGLSSEDQARVVQEISELLAPYYTQEVAKHLVGLDRSKMDLAVAGQVDAVRSVITWQFRDEKPTISWSGGEFRLQLPEELTALVPPERCIVPAPQMSCRLENVVVDAGDLRIEASVQIMTFDGTPDALGVIARRRSDGAVETFSSTTEHRSSGPGSFFVSAEHRELDRGVWDVYVVVRFGTTEKKLRLGSDHAKLIPPEGVSSIGEESGAPGSIIAYFTKGAGNLSIDSGLVLHKSVARAESLGLTLDENGRAVLLVRTTRRPERGDEFFCTVKGVTQHGGRDLLPAVKLGERLLGLRLPVSTDSIGSTLTVTAVLGGASCELPITGTEFWPSRAAGYGLVSATGGAISVAPVRKMPRVARVSRPSIGGARPAGAATSRRVATALKAVPVLGPMAVRGVRSIRRRIR